jgi:hypothetical protein
MPSTPRQRVPPGRLVAGLVLLALGGAAVGGTLFVRAVNRTHLDPGVLAVAPLAVGVSGDGLDTAGPAIARQLVAALRAGGIVHPVPLDSVAAAWDAGLAPAAAAVLLAQRTGAGLVVLAQLWPAAGSRDSVLLAARLLDVSNNVVRALYEIRCPRRGGVSSLGDSLATLVRRDVATAAPGTPPGRAR